MPTLRDRLFERLAGDFIGHHFDELADAARQGYAAFGRGCIRVDAEGEGYMTPGPELHPADLLAGQIAAYDPSREFIVAFLLDEGHLSVVVEFDEGDEEVTDVVH